MTTRGATRKKQRQGTPRSRPVNTLRVLRRLAAAALGVAMLALVLLAGWQLRAMPVERVVVSGELNHVDRQALQSTINESLAGGFLLLDLQALRATLEKLPWVDRVIVRRQWPDSIHVRVIEQRAIARWGESALLNHAGEVFGQATAAGVPELPILSGPDGSHAVLMRHYQLIQERLQPLGLSIGALRMNPRGGLRASLVNGSELVLGRERIAEKLNRLEAVYNSRLATRRAELARIDLRYSHGVAVAWRDHSASRRQASLGPASRQDS